MKRLSLALLALVMLETLSLAADSRCFELRTYYAAPGKLEALHARFRDHTMKIFEKHGMQNIGYWVPQENPQQKLIYLLAFPNREAARKAWKEFGSDPDWQKARAESEKNGKLVTNVVSRFLTLTDYSPGVAPSISSEPHAFELRTYTASQGNLQRLDERFRKHTVKLFEKHGMRNFGYWHLMPDQKGADNTLIYLLSHKSKEAGLASFKAFREDPAWIAAKADSEKEAGGSLTEGGMAGVESVYLNPTDYSPAR